MTAWDPAFDRGKPIFRPLRAAIDRFRGHRDWPSLDDWNAAMPEVWSDGGARIRFVEQPPKRRNKGVNIDAIYDERIYVRGEVPSRTKNWHDFFNMLVWATFPNTKRAINARQRKALRERVDPSMTKLPGERTKEQDALAMLDEGGLILATRIELDAAIEAADFDTIEAAIHRDEARAFLLGHAIYEHHVVGTGELRALVHRVSTDSFDLRTVDVLVGDSLRAGQSVLRQSWVPGLPVREALFVE